MEKVNHWIKKGFTMEIEGYWYYKMLCEKISWVLVAYVLVKLSRMRTWLEVVTTLFLFFQIYNLWAFLYNFNQWTSYKVVYPFAGIATGLIYFVKFVLKKYKPQKRNQATDNFKAYTYGQERF
jgi:hypothetical protein